MSLSTAPRPRMQRLRVTPSRHATRRNRTPSADLGHRAGHRQHRRHRGVHHAGSAGRCRHHGHRRSRCRRGGAMLLAVLFGQLTKRVPNSDGGLYAYSRHEFGDFAGYLVGWCYWIQSWAGNAAIVSSWSSTSTLCSVSPTRAGWRTSASPCGLWVPPSSTWPGSARWRSSRTSPSSSSSSAAVRGIVAGLRREGPLRAFNARAAASTAASASRPAWPSSPSSVSRRPPSRPSGCATPGATSSGLR